MNDVERYSGTRNATILMILAGALQIYSGYQFHQMAIIMTYPLHSIFGIFLIGLGVLSFGTSLVVWLQISWATEMIAGVGIAVCVTLIIFGFYLIIVIFGSIYYIARNQLRQEIKDNEWLDTYIGN
ncbi:MAG: hypothetical protein RTV72_12110 [Candidatus Thorarchaeota archaeon]